MSSAIQPRRSSISTRRLWCQRTIALILAILSAGSLDVCAQEFPSRPLRLVVGFVPGGGADLMGRMIAGLLTDQLGKQVLVDNRGGAGGTLAAETVANGQPDGHTLLLMTIANALHPWVYKLNYDPARQLAPVALLGRGGYVLGMTPSLPASDLKALLAIARAKPGELLMGNSGAGSFVHLASVLFSQTAGADIVHVAYKGSGPALIDVLGGRAHLVIGAPGQLASHIRAGKLKALGVTDTSRSPLLPDVPTIAEAGLPGYEAANWWGLAATGGTPRTTIDKLHSAVIAVLGTAKARAQFEAEGAQAAPAGPDEFHRFLAAETGKWGQIVRAANIKAE